MPSPLSHDDTEDVFSSFGWFETVLFCLFLVGAIVVIFLLTLGAWLTSPLVRLVQGGDFAGPYRQVR